jgi:hypothetical protein
LLIVVSCVYTLMHVLLLVPLVCARGQQWQPPLVDATKAGLAVLCTAMYCLTGWMDVDGWTGLRLSWSLVTA